MTIPRWYVLHLNPEPWAMGEAYRAGKAGIKVAPNPNLRAYQDAVRGELEGEPKLPEARYHLQFYFFRQTAKYLDASDRVQQRNAADATNMQKALEDALQGVLFDNDRDVSKVESTIVAQGATVDPCIVIHVDLWHSSMKTIMTDFPEDVKSKVMEGPVKPMSDNVWRGPRR